MIWNPPTGTCGAGQGGLRKETSESSSSLFEIVGGGGSSIGGVSSSILMYAQLSSFDEWGNISKLGHNHLPMICLVAGFFCEMLYKCCHMSHIFTILSVDRYLSSFESVSQIKWSHWENNDIVSWSIVPPLVTCSRCPSFHLRKTVSWEIEKIGSLVIWQTT